MMNADSQKWTTGELICQHLSTLQLLVDISGASLVGPLSLLLFQQLQEAPAADFPSSRFVSTRSRSPDHVPPVPMVEPEIKKKIAHFHCQLPVLWTFKGFF
jgi:hypothetical protein